MALADVVVVSYNSREELRDCVEPLAADGDIHVVVVDNASADDTLATVADLPIERVQLADNRGFAHGCNTGWRRSSAPFVLFLNPDARITGEGVRRLAHVVEADGRAGAAAPRIVHADGTLDYSQRRFPRLVSTYAQALFLHRLLPRASWVDEVIRDEGVYEQSGTPEWVSGACVLVRRTALERLGGLDDGFFMYCEDTDLCRRLRDLGLHVLFEPEAVVVHRGGASAPRPSLFPVLAASRVRYAQKHSTRSVALLARLGIALGALTHIAISRGGADVRAGHARSLVRALTGAGAAPDHPSV